MNPEVSILIGDCREQLRALSAESVQCVVTSPPYFALRSYLPDGDPAKQLEIGSESNLNDFLKTMVEVFAEVRRVLRPDGTCWVNFGDTFQNKRLMGIPWQVAFALQADGWILRSEIIWHKPNPVPEPDRGRPTVAHETLFLFAKSERYFYDNDAIREPAGDEPDWESYNASLGSNIGCDSHRWTKGYKKMSHNQTHPNGRQKRSVWTIPTKGFPGAHYATFPPALVEPCVLAGTSAMGCCSNCGAPRRRLTEHTVEYKARIGQSWHDHQDDLNRGQRGIPSAFRGAPARVTTGWEPTCECNAESVPCTVLDPFGGSGTVGEVALNHGRSAILIDLDERNRKFMEERTGQMRLGLFG